MHAGWEIYHFLDLKNTSLTLDSIWMLDSVPRTLFGKVREIWLSWRLAAGMNKDEILSAYINRLPM